jgi:hypothetical protein
VRFANRTKSLDRGSLKLRNSKTGACVVPLNDMAIAVLTKQNATNQISMSFKVRQQAVDLRWGSLGNEFGNWHTLMPLQTYTA